jgi:hypothetical protein
VKPITNRILQLSLIAGGIAILALAPRGAHAITAALVQVTNTPSTPASTLDSSNAGSQQILLQTPYGATLVTGQQVNMVQLSPTLGIPNQNGYTVPAGSSLVVTGLDLVVYSRMTSALELRIQESSGSYGYEGFNQMAPGFYNLRFPSGMVYPAGTNVILDNSQGNSNVEAVIHGYLTAQ